MTDATTGRHADDGFWIRVRQALTGRRPDGERAPAYGQAAIARSIGMKPKLGNRIDEELVSGWARAAARNVSLCLMVVEIDRMREYFTAYGKAATDECVLMVMRAITEQLPRDGDLCLRMGRAGFVIVLPDLPALMARASANKIAAAIRELGLAHKESHAGIVTASIGLAVGNPQGQYDRRFFEAADGALKKAQRRGLGRLEAIDLRPDQERRRKAA